MVTSAGRPKARAGAAVPLAALRHLAHRFSFFIFVFSAVTLLVAGRLDVHVIELVRSQATDLAAPILDAVSRPVSTVSQAVQNAQELADLRAENQRLEAQLLTLRQFESVAFRLEAEVEQLRALTHYTPVQAHRFLTARVIADNSGVFVRSLALALGQRNGVADGQAVIGNRGLAGRVVQAGDRSARVLLMTDLNARIPVMLERSRQRAVTGGDNTALPRLEHLPPDAPLTAGERVVTSGHGGMFPYGLPVGEVVIGADGQPRVRPFEDLSRLEFVRVVDFRPQDTDAQLRPLAGR